MVRLARSCEKCLFDLPTPDPRDPGVTYFTPPRLKPQRVSPNGLCARVQAASSPSWHDIGLLRLVLLADLRLARSRFLAPRCSAVGGRVCPARKPPCQLPWFIRRPPWSTGCHWTSAARQHAAAGICAAGGIAE